MEKKYAQTIGILILPILSAMVVLCYQNCASSGPSGNGANSSSIITSDSFNRASLGSATDAALGGSSLPWTIQYGNPSIQGSAFASNNMTGTGITLDSGFSNCTVEAKLITLPPISSTYVAFRFKDSSHFWALLVTPGGGTYHLAKAISGPLHLVTASAITPQAGDIIQISYAGPDITITVTHPNAGGQSSFNVSDSSLQTETGVGLATTTSFGIFDDFIVRDCR